MQNKLKIRGKGTWILRDKHGCIKDCGVFFNGTATVGENYALDTSFRGTSQTSTWYMGLVKDAATVTFADADTMASHAGWTESTDYTEANRVTLSFSAASGGVLATSSAAQFTMNGTDDIYGVFVTTDNTKGGTSGTLWATGAHTSVIDPSASDTIDVTYEIELVSTN